MVPAADPRGAEATVLQPGGIPVPNQSAYHRNRTPDVNLNLNVRGLKPSATVAINERCNELIRQGRSIYKLGLGQSPFPVPSSVVDTLRTHADRKDYLAVRGLAELRAAVADYHRRRQGLACSFEDVLVGPGSKELMFLLQLVYYGELVVPTPSWVSYAPQAAIIGRTISWLPTSRASSWQITPEHLEDDLPRRSRPPAHRRPELPQQPHGRHLQAGRAEGHRRGRPPLSRDPAVRRDLRRTALPRAARVGGALLPRGDHRLGRPVQVVRRGRLAAGRVRLPAAAALAPGRHGRRGQRDLHLDQRPHPVRRRARLLRRRATSSGTCGTPGASCALWAAGATAPWRRRAWTSSSPQGAFYLFPDFSPLADRLAARGITSAPQLCARLLDETGVAVLPGSDFGRPLTELTARLAYVNFDGAQALAAAEVLPRDAPLDDAFLRQCCGNTLAAMERLAEWVASSPGTGAG